MSAVLFFYVRLFIIHYLFTFFFSKMLPEKILNSNHENGLISSPLFNNEEIF